MLICIMIRMTLKMRYIFIYKLFLELGKLMRWKALDNNITFRYRLSPLVSGRYYCKSLASPFSIFFKFNRLILEWILFDVMKMNMNYELIFCSEN